MRYETDEEIQQNYNLESLVYSCDWWGKESKRAFKQKEKFAEQIRLVKKTNFRKVVRLRKLSHEKPVRYSVILYYIPDIKGGENKYYPSDFCEIFEGGKRKKEAIEYALRLAKEHDAELIKEGM